MNSVRCQIKFQYKKLCVYTVCIILLFCYVGTIAQAQTRSQVNVQGTYAIGGYDPVAYFTKGEPIQGIESLYYEYKGARWLFASEEHQSLFITNPEQYAPQYGGYCAYAIARGYFATIDPSAWTVDKDKLYLNFSRSIKRRWEREISENIEKGNAYWTMLFTKKDHQ